MTLTDWLALVGTVSGTFGTITGGLALWQEHLRSRIRLKITGEADAARVVNLSAFPVTLYAAWAEPAGGGKRIQIVKVKAAGHTDLIVGLQIVNFPDRYLPVELAPLQRVYVEGIIDGAALVLETSDGKIIRERVRLPRPTVGS